MVAPDAPAPRWRPHPAPRLDVTEPELNPPRFPPAPLPAPFDPLPPSWRPAPTRRPAGRHWGMLAVVLLPVVLPTVSEWRPTVTRVGLAGLAVVGPTVGHTAVIPGRTYGCDRRNSTMSGLSNVGGAAKVGDGGGKLRAPRRQQRITISLAGEGSIGAGARAEGISAGFLGLTLHDRPFFGR